MTRFADRLEFSTEHLEGGGDVVAFRGCINEHAPEVFARVLATLGDAVTIDLGGVSRINSLGVRAWTKFLEGLGKRSVVLRRCVPAFVEQLNVIAGFRGKARIDTVLAPYLCTVCGKVFNEELTLGVDLPLGQRVEGAPARSCPTCHNQMEFDDFAERYFAFVAQM